jgi:hypothetical protein
MTFLKMGSSANPQSVHVFRSTRLSQKLYKLLIPKYDTGIFILKLLSNISQGTKESHKGRNMTVA